MEFHPRSDWTSVRAANANPVIRSLLRGVAIHWNGPAVPRSAFTDPRAYLEGVRRYHVNTNGWSDIAYNYAVDQSGDAWELRGWGYQSGANGDAAVNDAYLAILCILGEGQKPSPEMLAGVAAAVAAFRVRYSTARKIVTHAAIRPSGTACPGPDLIREVAAGTFDNTPAPEEPDVQLTDRIDVSGTDAGEASGATSVEVGDALRRMYEWTFRSQRDSAVARALSEAAAKAGRPLTATETEAAVAAAIAKNVLHVDVSINQP